MPAPKGLRFCMVTTFYPPYHFGGDAVVIRLLAHALARRGHTVDVIHEVDAFAALHRGSLPAPLEEPPGVRTHPLRSRLGKLSIVATHQLGRPVLHARRIRRILHSGFDVINFHNVSLVGGPGVLAYGRGIKLYTAHEHWLVCPTHVLWRNDRELCDRRDCLKCVLNYRRPPQMWRYTGLLPRMIRHIDEFISPSRFSADKHQEFGFSKPFEVIPLFLPDPDSGVEEVVVGSEAPPKRPYFLFVGRLEKIKGLQDVLPHFRGEGDTDLIVAGTGEYESELKRIAAGAPRIQFLGRCPIERLRGLYKQAIALIVPSVCYETFAIVLLEAFRERTPVIARGLGSIIEIVESSGGGLLYHHDQELAAALRRLSGDQELRQRMGENGFAAWQSRWTESVVLQQYLALIERIARSRGDQSVIDRLDATGVRQ